MGSCLHFREGRERFSMAWLHSRGREKNVALMASRHEMSRVSGVPPRRRWTP